MLVVNLYGAPGAGKSTGAAYIFSKLKMLGVNAELVTEFAKDKVWEESKAVFQNQAYIFGKQYFRISRVDGKVDVVITDSPILLSAFYNTDPILGEEFDAFVTKVSESYNSLNLFINRVKPYNPAGRFQTEEESDELSSQLHQFLDNHNVKYFEYNGTLEDYDTIVTQIATWEKFNK
ncbi:MAG: ATP-binding protein [Acetobacter sp.]|nr:ATP-binding protein [Acetobacter sp.]